MKTKLLSVLTALAASFAAAEYSITASVNDGAMGAVAGVKESYEDGEIAEITAVANDGYWFYRWESEDIDSTLAFSPTLRVNGAATVTAVFGKAIYAAPEGLADNDGSSWESATTISNAIASAVEGNVVVISNGIYTANKHHFIYVTNSVALRGYTGNRDDVIINGSSKYTLARLGGSGGLIADLTLKNGKPDGRETFASLYLAAGAAASNIRITGANSNDEYHKYAGVYANGATIVDSLLDGNTTGGGRIYPGYVLYTSDGALVARCCITNNRATHTSYMYEASTVYISGSKTIVRDSIIANNSYNISKTLASGQTFTTGVRIDSGYLINSAIVDNYYSAATPLSMGGVRANGGKIINCIMKNNDRTSKDNEVNWVGTKSCFTNCYTTDDGNALDSSVIKPVSEADYVYEDGEITIPFGSPLLNSGADLEALGLGNTLFDINYAKRISGSAIDIGPTEYQMAALNCSFSAPFYVAMDKLVTTLTSTVDGENLAGLTYAWDTDGDGKADVSGSDMASINIEITAFGETTVSLTVTNADGDSASFDAVFTVNPTKLYVVSGNENAKAPYASWHTAAATITDALSAATDGATVILTNGTYMTYGIGIGKAITFRGATDDFRDCVINGSGKSLILSVKNSNAIVTALTIKNGRGHRSTGGIYNEGGTITNCCITGNFSTDMDGAGAGINNVSGKVIDCLIIGNYTANRPYGAGIYQSGTGAVTERYIITNNYSTGTLNYKNQTPGASIQSGVIRNCLIAHNWLRQSITETTTRHAAGLLISNARAENCTIISNRVGAHVEGTYVSGINGSNSKIVNCLIADNLCGSMTTNWIAGTTSYTNCCTTAAVELIGEGNREATARTYRMLNDGAYTFGNRSPLLNGGTPMSWAEGDIDLYGNPRIYGGKIDIGCVELKKTAPTIMTLQ